MRRFVLNRIEDETGILGIGIVAEGVQFSRGEVALSWLTQFTSIVIYDGMDQIEAIHGHNGKTRIEWIDDGPG